MKDELDPVNPNELIIRILKQIQADAQANREELQAEIRSVSARIDALGEHLGARIGAVELTLVDLATQQGTTVSVLRDLRQRVSLLEAGSG